MSSSRPKSMVCTRCAAIKQGCSGGIPCERCVRLSLPCHPKSGPGSSPQSTDPGVEQQGQSQAKARIRRVHTGCLTCKKRKKKCDETKPSCGNCRRLCLGCSWPNGRSNSVADVGNGWSSDAWLLDQSMEQHPEASQRVGASAPIESHLDMSIADLLCQMSGFTDPDAAAPDALPLDNDARLGDLAWSLSPDPPWLDMLPQTPSVPSAPSPSPSSPSASPVEDLSLTLYRPSLMPDLKSPYDKALLNHYSTVVTSVLSRCSNPSANPYLTYLLPMAMSNTTVLHSVLALSATHWQRLQPQMQGRALFHRGEATQSLASLLPHVDGTSIDVALVSCLLLCMTELFDGTSPGWKLHLQGAKRLFATLRDQHGDQLTGHNKFLVKLTRFLDSAATTSTCKPPLIGDETDTKMADFADLAGEDAAVYGIPKELFHLVDRVNNLASKRGTRVDDASEALFRQEAEAVQAQLDNWALDYGGLSGAVAVLGPLNDDILHATTAYEWALRLRLHQITEGYSLSDSKVLECVERILDAAQKIRYGSALETCLLFPLVMAGGACDKLEHRIIIHDRLMVMERTCGFGYIHQSRELVEKVWKRREATESRVNWARIRYEEMGGLAIF